MGGHGLSHKHVEDHCKGTFVNQCMVTLMHAYTKSDLQGKEIHLVMANSNTVIESSGALSVLTRIRP